ncbi:lipopolysaccharide biosynthesis protein [Novosphingobium beihaiensis]|uniref:Lipopolysaccharide biosynthesis protein n=1 Tax=Novosphingobium beihaiensis TaxID=2930389 RepID=A0ABT0BL43_9SPHN|nr:lipopolysaccharide biosynthesis protein [Novosphingobium beihaiensis]MCJ2185444.1 lipopolysaccharide biosynthesis protein [Novosphingobium beihaiensis]
MTGATEAKPAGPTLREQVRSAVIWRSGTQVFGQIISWLSTFLVIRILSPSDYGLFAMTSVVLGLLALLNGYGLANAYIQQRETSERMLQQLFGMLIVLNGTLAAIQIAAAPLAAAYYRQPMVADMLRVQALIYLTNPFLALGYAILSREMDFRRQAQVNIVSAIIGAFAALGGALAGLGTWTLVLAPIVLFATRAAGMAFVAKAFVKPSFNFSGVRHIAGYGGMMTVSSMFWFVQTQADVVIAGRAFSPHELGIYTTSLFLAQIFVTKVVPPLNEVAFSVYARVQNDRAALAAGFVASTRVIMLLTFPFCLGLAVTAEPLVEVVLGSKWLEAAPVVRLLAMAMPFMTLHVLLAPATNAVGRPGLATRTTALGAVVMPTAFLIGVQFGSTGIAAAWLAAYPLLAICALAWSLPAIDVDFRALAKALAAPFTAAVAMALAVVVLDHALGAIAPVLRLALLVAAGAAVYGLWLFSFAREAVYEMIAFIRRR